VSTAAPEAVDDATLIALAKSCAAYELSPAAVEMFLPQWRKFANALLALTHPPAASEREGDEPSEKQKKLLALADRIDHEKLWRWAGMDHHKMTPEQRDRMNAGVELRRYARIWKADHWIVIPPIGPVLFIASTLDEAVEMAKRDAQRLGREKENGNG
jgi:hypothetical protein